MLVDTTLALENKVLNDLEAIKPDCIISDSLCIWGKLFAIKMKISYICSTTTFAFNEKTAKMMNQSFGEILSMILGMGQINKRIKLLQERGYEVKNFVSLSENKNDTNTIVYTSKEFYPMAETLSDQYAFIGPLISKEVVQANERIRKQIYI